MKYQFEILHPMEVFLWGNNGIIAGRRVRSSAWSAVRQSAGSSADKNAAVRRRHRRTARRGLVRMPVMRAAAAASG